MVANRSRSTLSRVPFLIALVIATVMTGCTNGAGTSSSSSPTTTLPDGVLERVDVKNLTDSQRAAFVGALRKLQTTPYPGDASISWYGQFIREHIQAFSCDVARGPVGAVHNSPLFLPWHREYLIRLENAMQQVSGDTSIRIPYWDWTDPASTAAVFSPDFMGGDGDPTQDYAVTDGPFAKGIYTIDAFDPPAVQEGTGVEQPFLVRRFGVFNGSTISLPTESDVSDALAVEGYDVGPWDASADSHHSFRNNLEGWRDALPPDCSTGWQDVSQVDGSAHVLHNVVHLWTGGMWKDESGATHSGSMVPNASPADPVFFLHHSNVDRIWAIWQSEHPDQSFPASAAGFTPQTLMWPWLDRTIESMETTPPLGYVYAPAN
jgi:tyrosinase